MPDTEILDALMVVFGAAHFRPLGLSEITEQLQRRGYYSDIPFSKALARVNSELCLERNSAHYPFIELGIKGEVKWALESWFPPDRMRKRLPRHRAPLPSLAGIQFQHNVSVDGQEVIAGQFPFQRERLVQLISGLSDQQQLKNVVSVLSYGNDIFSVSFDFDNCCLEGKGLGQWYRENHLRAGDAVWLRVEHVNPLVLKIYTEWDRDSDAYRRHIQRERLEEIPRTDLSIRELIWLYLSQRGRIAHHTEIVSSVIEFRPDASGRSVNSCLTANPQLFVSTGDRGYWGLKGWNITSVQILKPNSNDDPLSPVNPDRPTVTVPLDYVLINIQAEDLVCRILRSANTPLSYSEISDKIADYLHLDKTILKRTSFMNMEDARIVQLEDGKFALQEKLEGIIAELTRENRALEARVEQATRERDRKISDLTADLDQALSQYPQELEDLRLKAAQLTADLAVASDRNQELSKSLSSAGDDLADLQRQRSELENECQLVHVKLEEALRCADERMKDQASVQRELDCTRLEQQAVRKELAGERATADQSHQHAESLVAELEIANAALERARRMTEATQARLEDTATGLAAALERESELKGRLDQTNRELEESAIQARKAVAATLKLNNERTELRARIDQLARESSEHQTRFQNRVTAYFARPLLRVLWDVLRGRRPAD